jgi:hypothetical protein
LSTILRLSFLKVQNWVKSVMHKWDKSFIIYKLVFTIRSINLAIMSNKTWCEILIQWWDILIQENFFWLQPFSCTQLFSNLFLSLIYPSSSLTSPFSTPLMFFFSVICLVFVTFGHCVYKRMCSPSLVSHNDPISIL